MKRGKTRKFLDYKSIRIKMGLQKALLKENSVINDFKENFITGRLPIKQTVFYGLGENTRILLEKFPDYPVIGLLDGYQEQGWFYGKPILKLEEVRAEAKRIIIVARPGSTKIIFYRIAAFCRKHHIEVFSLQGKNLLRKNERHFCADPYFKKNEKDLLRAIDSHEGISFDVFGTLLSRKVWHPQDVFQVVSMKAGFLNFDFTRERIKAEQSLSGSGNLNIGEIYRRIAKRTNADRALLEKLFFLELETEKKLLEQRPVIVAALRYAVEKNKRVYLISDMYLSEQLLKELLQEQGITGYCKLLVSCEYGTDKQGELFELYKQLSQSKSYLHIGDDEYADGTCARRHGIDCYLIKSPYEMLELTPARRLMETSNNNNMMGLLERGMFAARAFQNPFALYGFRGKMEILKAYEFGFLYLAPVLTEFVFWLIGRLMDGNYSKICFISRDGYLVKKLYDAARERFAIQQGKRLPPSEYLLASRTLCVHASVRNEQDVEEAVRIPFDGSAEEMLHKRFHLTAEEMLPYEKKYMDDKEAYILLHREKIREKARELRRQYEGYLKPILGEERQKMAIFDFVSTGTCQLCLEKILKTSLKGFYFARLSGGDNKKDCLEIEDFAGAFPDIKTVVSDNYFMMENLIKEPAPSLSYIDAEGKGIYCEERRTQEQLSKIKCVQYAILDYFNQLLDIGLLKSDLPKMKGMGEKLLSLATEDYTDAKGTKLFSGRIMDEFYNRTIDLIQ